MLRLYTAPMELDPFADETIGWPIRRSDNFMNPAEVLAMAEDARRMPSREAEFRNLVLNQRVEYQQTVRHAERLEGLRRAALLARACRFMAGSICPRSPISPRWC